MNELELYKIEQIQKQKNQIFVKKEYNNINKNIT